MSNAIRWAAGKLGADDKLDAKTPERIGKLTTKLVLLTKEPRFGFKNSPPFLQVKIAIITTHHHNVPSNASQSYSCLLSRYCYMCVLKPVQSVLKILARRSTFSYDLVLLDTANNTLSL